MILSDRDLKIAIRSHHIRIRPAPDFSTQLGACSIDFRLGSEFRIFDHSKYPYIDPFNKDITREITRKIKVKKGEAFIIQPGDFVLGEIIVKYKDNQTPEELQEKAETRESRKNIPLFGSALNSIEDLNARRQGDKTTEEKIQELKIIEKKIPTVATENVFENTTPSARQAHLDDIKIIKTNASVSIDQATKIYESISSVEYAQPNYIDQPAAQIPNDTYYPQMWNLKKINVSQAWDTTKGSKNVIVAVIDTGIDYNHPDLPSDIIRGRNFAYSNNNPMDKAGHGTHVAGTIGASTNNGIGVSGVAWNVRLMAVKVFHDEDPNHPYSYESDWAEGIRWAADNGARVINLSLGGDRSGPCPNVDPLAQGVINYARQKGAVVIVAAANAAKDAQFVSPASCNGVIAVGATGPNDERASYSNFGSIVDIAAPGGAYCHPSSDCSIVSTYPNSSLAYMEGTSMAAPHVAGVAALLLAQNPNLTPDQVEQRLKDTAETISTDQPIGKRLNAYYALLGSIPTPTPTLAPTPTLGPLPQGNEISWKTATVSLEADNFYITTSGRYFLGKDPSISIRSDPGNKEYTTLEATWHENGVEMRLNMYFEAQYFSPPGYWGITEMRTYNGREQGDWVYFNGFSGNQIGTPYTAPSQTFFNKGSSVYKGSVTFENLRLLPFVVPTPTNTPTPTFTPTPIPPTATPTPVIARKHFSRY